MQQVILAKNAIEPDTWTLHECEDVRAFLVEEFVEWPPTARIYRGAVAVENDVTPADAGMVDKLATYKDPLIVVVYPAGPLAIFVAIAVAVVAVAAIAFLLIPVIPTVDAAGRNNHVSSANNDLSQRSNRPRVNARIEDIYGTLRSTPSLIALPYTTFEDNREIEHAYLCIGRGTYDVSLLKDGDTLLSEIDGCSAEVYAPNTSPNSGDSPQTSVGAAIGERVRSVVRTNSVNGQTLQAPTTGNTIPNDWLVYPNYVYTQGDYIGDYKTGEGFYSIYFTDFISVGDTIDIVTGTYSNGIDSIDVSGSYTVTEVTNYYIALSSPAAVEADWNLIDDYYGGTSGTIAGYVDASGGGYIGSFTLDVASCTEVICNFVAPNGMYKDDGTSQTSTNVLIEVGLTPVDASGTETGEEQLFYATVVGSSTTRDRRAATVTCTPTIPGRQKVRARRVTAFDSAFAGTVVDEVKWRDCYAMSPVTQDDFGDVTTVQLKTRSTEGALAVKERKFNCLVTRKVPVRTSGSTFGALTATNRADAILSAICLDEFIGARATSEIDFDSIYDTCDELDSYFGTTAAAEFCYTFDNANMSFEETVATIAQAIFCNAYRRGNVIKLSFEKATSNSTLLFNHRNKLPGTETRTVRFGNQENYDGVYYSYVDPVDDSIATYYIPDDRSATKPKEVDGVGIRSRFQAKLHAYRIWNKIRYQNTTAEFEATQEAEIAVRGDRVLVTDNTRPDTRDGEVLNVNVLELTLSQPPALNLFPYSEDFSQSAWTKAALTISSNAAENTIGLKTADKLVETATTAQHALSATLTSTASALYTVSIDVKAAGRDYARVLIYDGGSNYYGVNIDLTDGSVTTSTGGSLSNTSYEVIDFGDDWYRVVVSATAPSTTFGLYVNACDSMGNLSYAGDITKGIYVDRAQIEKNSNGFQRYGKTGATATYSIFLQLKDGTVESRTVTPGTGENKVVLNLAPTLSLITDDSVFARTTYQITGSADTRSSAFLLMEKDPKSSFTTTVKAVNYDSRYYQNDLERVVEATPTLGRMTTTAAATVT